MKNNLIIGGMGYVGTVVIESLLKDDENVTCIDNFSYNQEPKENFFENYKNFKFINLDIRKFDFKEDFLNNFDNVIIFAGLVGDPITKKYPEQSIAINDVGLKRIIDSLDHSSVKRVIFISTCSNYGLIKENAVADEQYELKPLSSYAKSKVNIENYLLNKKNKVGYSGVILRFATAFGLSPRMRFDLTINEFTRELYINNKIIVYDENTWRPYCHVKDFSNLIKKVIRTNVEKINFQVFNAGSERNNATKLDIVNYLKPFFPEAEIIFKSQGSDPRNYRVNFDKVKNTLGFKAEYNIEDGIKEIIQELNQGHFKIKNYYPDNLGNYVLRKE